MLAPTSNAPIKNRLLMVVAFKGSTPGNSKRQGANQTCSLRASDSNLRYWRAVKKVLNELRHGRVWMRAEGAKGLSYREMGFLLHFYIGQIVSTAASHSAWTCYEPCNRGWQQATEGNFAV